jgi:hypothetical protein
LSESWLLSGLSLDSSRHNGRITKPAPRQDVAGMAAFLFCYCVEQFASNVRDSQIAFLDASSGESFEIQKVVLAQSHDFRTDQLYCRLLRVRIFG